MRLGKPTTSSAPIRLLAGVILIGGIFLTSWAAGANAPATQPTVVHYLATDSGSKATVSGTSTFHDWSASSSVLKGGADFTGTLDANSGPDIALHSIYLAIPVNSLKSTEGGGMDNVMWDALKQKQCPAIVYNLTKSTLKSVPTKQDPAYHFATTGELLVAGATRPEDLDLAITPGANGQLTIAIQIGMKMTDFSVPPPTAMLGMIKSGDAITVKVNWLLATKP